MDIKKLREKYEISQAELAEKLGISRYTLIKTEQGRRALTRKEEQKAREVFALLGEDFGDSMDDDLRINIPQRNIEKFKEVLLYILEKVGAKPNVGLTVLYKLLYFIDFDYYEQYEEQLMGLSYIKNHHGPTPREFAKVMEAMKKDGEVEEVKSSFFQFEQKKYLPRRKADVRKLKKREKQVIDRVLNELSDMNAKEISTYVHGDVPWLTVEQGENIDYEFALYREAPYSVRRYGDL